MFHSFKYKIMFLFFGVYSISTCSLYLYKLYNYFDILTKVFQIIVILR